MAAAIDWNAAFRKANALVDEESRLLGQEGRGRDDELDQMENMLTQPADVASATERAARAAAGVWFVRTGIGVLDLDWNALSPELRRRMARTLVGAALYRADHGGRWPEKLSDVTPGYLKELPEDPFAAEAGSNVRWVAGSNRVEVYSVGRNGKDDEGQAIFPEGDDIAVGVTDEAP